MFGREVFQQEADQFVRSFYYTDGFGCGDWTSNDRAAQNPFRRNDSDLSPSSTSMIQKYRDAYNQPVKYDHSLADAGDFSTAEVSNRPADRHSSIVREMVPHWNCPSGSRGCMLSAIAAATWCLIPVAAAVIWTPHLRIGAGFGGFTLGVAAIPLRRDESVKPTSLIPIYVLSLACTTIFITSQYHNITRRRGQYLFGTFVLAGHFVGALSQTSDTTLDGIIDLGPVLLPAIAALVSLLYPRRRPTFSQCTRRPLLPIQETATGAAAEDSQTQEEGDIGMERLDQLSDVVAGLPLSDY
ncbi:hypothetical protein F5Y19DRAFT_159731 [Xylariaceae sp. FL1651]|nr:hypothetical protein F5Y19DRAFT_159731 [Xylariaceae sp. FL1651]